MQTQSMDHNKSGSPTLLKSKCGNGAAILPKIGRKIRSGSSGDVIEVLREAVDQNGLTFLFEIPAALFERPDIRAAVIRSPKEQGKAQYLFLLCEPQEGIISVMDLDEIPEAARSFFLSYAGVLSSLSKMPAVKKLH